MTAAVSNEELELSIKGDVCQIKAFARRDSSPLGRMARCRRDDNESSIDSSAFYFGSTG